MEKFLSRIFRRKTLKIGPSSFRKPTETVALRDLLRNEIADIFN